MGVAINTLSCPNCGSPQSMTDKVCQYCGSALIITSFNSVQNMDALKLNKYVRSYAKTLKDGVDEPTIFSSIALCYMKLKFYDKALANFEKAIEEDFDNSELYFYACVCVLEGKSPFLHVKATVQKAETFIQAAISIEPKGIYYYMWSYIRYEYYNRKDLRISPSYEELMRLANSSGISDADKINLKRMLTE